MQFQIPDFTFYDDEYIKVSLATSPSTFGDALVTIADPIVQAYKPLRLTDLRRPLLVSTFLSIRHAAHKLYAGLARQDSDGLAPRIGLVTTGLVADGFKLTPLNGTQGLGWHPRNAFEESDINNDRGDGKPNCRGYLDSKGRSTPRNAEELSAIQERILDCNDRQVAGENKSEIGASLARLTMMPDTSFSGPIPTESTAALFTRLVRHEGCKPGLNHWRVWESTTHVAFLTPYSNYDGFTVLVPRRWICSDIFGCGESGAGRGPEMTESDYEAMIQAIYEVTKVLETGFAETTAAGKDVSTQTIGIMFEGFEIDYAHAKLVPLNLPRDRTASTVDYVAEYQGFIDSRWGPPLDLGLGSPDAGKLEALHRCILAQL